jgi:hypothetical protein
MYHTGAIMRQIAPKNRNNTVIVNQLNTYYYQNGTAMPA